MNNLRFLKILALLITSSSLSPIIAGNVSNDDTLTRDVLNQPSLSNLPSKLLIDTFSFLGNKEVYSSAVVCHQFLAIAEGEFKNRITKITPGYKIDEESIKDRGIKSFKHLHSLLTYFSNPVRVDEDPRLLWKSEKLMSSISAAFCDPVALYFKRLIFQMGFEEEEG